MTQPLVSVITPVYNCRDTVAAALESAFAQSLPPEQIEVIAVDDGSTDGSAELLDELARVHDRLTVIHQTNTGGPGAPRNRGLEVATGEFVFFLDADDALGPEALERMTAMAQRNGTDIVLGKQVGTGGRRVPPIFEETIERTHVLDEDCDLLPRMSMAALQLFRRSLIDKAELRFTEGMLSHEDHLFTTGAYLNASGVSLLADYDCYYWAARADGTSTTQLGGASTADVHAVTAEAMAMIAKRTDPGEKRERLHYRYLHQEVFTRLERRYLDASDEERETARKGCRELLNAWLTPGLLARYNTLRRVVAHCVLQNLDAELEEILRFHRDGRRPEVLLEDGRAYALYPYFRQRGIPDESYETPVKLRATVTGVAGGQAGLVVDGTVLIPGVTEGTPEVHLIAEHSTGARHRFPCTTGAGDLSEAGRATAFTGTIDPPAASWPDGRWALSVEAVIEGHTLTAPLSKPADVPVPHAFLVPADGDTARLVRPQPATSGHGRLRMNVGATLTSSDLRDVEVGWMPRRRLRVAVEAPSGPGADMSVVLHRPGAADAALRVPLTPDPDRPARRVAEIPLAGVRPGSWRVAVQIDGSGDPVKLRVPGGEILGPVTASVLPPRRVHVKPDPMTVLVRVPLAARLKRVLRRLSPGRARSVR
ncbi:glycosyl transferase family 2 [Actinomadura pelletieri DSM 43383]|uniref:Glycosyl transferase family 2 n=1 Tax=Actinomadura pelletieri DSM 43383 TaxID=1120940 RepID=A0A495QA99_9ACTN|nr:glycosyltransferase [Actinomadura pelletieri]RKS68395.1 glycosyl transferase family 2 [Actinomadura pelletieri DSM 43383]